MKEWMSKKELTAYHLKWIAIITMTIDHVGKTIGVDWYMDIAQFFHISEYYGFIIYSFLFAIGTMTIYIFMWFIAEGCRYTKDIKKYLLRLFIFALISEIPFQFMIQVIQQEPLSIQLGFSSILATFTFGAFACYLYQKCMDKGYNFLSYTPVIILAVIAYLLKTDYDFFGVISIFFLYKIEATKKRLFALILLIFFFRGFYIPMLEIISYGFTLEFIPIYIFNLAFSLLSVPLLSKYNGKRGKSSMFNKYLFYAYYPIHIMLLVLIYVLQHS